MPLPSAQAAGSIVKSVMASAGMPGATVTFPTGTGNPWHQMLEVVAEEFVSAATLAITTTVWTCVEAPLGALGVGVSPPFVILPIQFGAQVLAAKPPAAAEAAAALAESGFPSTPMAVTMATSMSGAAGDILKSVMGPVTVSVTSTTMPIPNASFWEGVPTAVPAAVLSASIQTRWNALPMLAGSDSSQRVKTGNLMASSVSSVINNLRMYLSITNPASVIPPTIGLVDATAETSII